MKIFQFKYPGGETDWVFAKDQEDAEKFYLNHSGCGDLEECSVTEIPEEEWEHNYLLDMNESDPCYDEDDEEFEDYNEDDYYCGYKISGNLKEYAETHTKTDIIATSDF